MDNQPPCETEESLNTGSDDETAYSSPLYPDISHLRSEIINKCTPLTPPEIRWFFKESKTTVFWKPFIGYDSLQLEFQYCALMKLGKCEEVIVRGGLYKVDIQSRTYQPIYWTEEPAEVLRGTWFNSRTWQPLPEGRGDTVEAKHQELFGENGKCNDSEPTTTSHTSAGRKQAIGTVSFPDCHVEWYGINQVYLFKEGTFSKVTRSVTVDLFGLHKVDTAHDVLTRGYSVLAQDSDAPTPVTDLVFVVHGIAQKPTQQVHVDLFQAHQVHNMCTSLRNLIQKFEKEHYPHLMHTHRAEFIPVEWRSQLKLDEGMLDMVTLNKLRTIREFANASVLDVLYYTSPLYNQEIVDAVINEIIRLYAIFIQLNPSFEPNKGKVSLIGHSLGSVICYDILTRYNPIDLFVKKINLQMSTEQTKKDECMDSSIQEYQDCKLRLLELEKKIVTGTSIQPTCLPFHVENYFAVGSPLGCFLALRGHQPLGDGKIDGLLSKSAANRFYNLFHPSDPVAFRLEPILLPHYNKIQPVKVFKWNAKDRVPYHTLVEIQVINESEAKQADATEVSASAEDPKKSKKKGSFGGFMKNLNKIGEGIEAEYSKKKVKVVQKTKDVYNRDGMKQEYAVELPSKEELPNLQLEFRVDYALREQNTILDGRTGALAMATAHIAYWQSKDTAMFLLMTLFPQD